MKVQCLCENKFEVKPITAVDLDSDSEFIGKIKAGTFNGFKCPKCGTLVRPETVIHITWMSKGIKIASVPEKMRYLCLSFCTNRKAAEKSGEKCPFDSGEIPVIGNWELLDRVNSINAGLETVPLEALKFIILDGAKGDKSKIEISLKSVSDGKLEFYGSGVSEEMGIIHVPLELYENMASDYKKHKKGELFSAVASDVYISYKNIVME